MAERGRCAKIADRMAKAVANPDAARVAEEIATRIREDPDADPTGRSVHP